MQDSTKPLKFNGTASGYFVAALVGGVMTYVFVIGWPIAFNFVANWVVESVELEGRKLKYSAGYGEVLGFLLINILLVMVTFGIYIFWFAPKIYKFILDHTSYADEVAATEAQPVPPTPVEPPASSAPINI